MREQARSAVVEYSRIVLKGELANNASDREGFVSVGKPLGEPRTNVTDGGHIERELAAALRWDEGNAGCVPFGEGGRYAICGRCSLAHG